MSEEPRERELRALFRRERERDESAAPPFRRVWAAARAQARLPRTRRRNARWAAALLAAGAAGLYAFALLRPLPEVELDALRTTAEEIGAWEAPLDFLLATPGLELIETTPSFGRALFDDAYETNVENQERTQS